MGQWRPYFTIAKNFFEWMLEYLKNVRFTFWEDRKGLLDWSSAPLDMFAVLGKFVSVSLCSNFLS